jgi:hypothetical protein
MKIEVESTDRIELIDPKTKQKYHFFVGQDADGNWLAFTQYEIIQDVPHFCIECLDREDAISCGYAAHRLHFIDKKNKK